MANYDARDRRDMKLYVLLTLLLVAVVAIAAFVLSNTEWLADRLYRADDQSVTRSEASNDRYTVYRDDEGFITRVDQLIEGDEPKTVFDDGYRPDDAVWIYDLRPGDGGSYYVVQVPVEIDNTTKTIDVWAYATTPTDVTDVVEFYNSTYRPVAIDMPIESSGYEFSHLIQRAITSIEFDRGDGLLLGTIETTCDWPPEESRENQCSHGYWDNGAQSFVDMLNQEHASNGIKFSTFAREGA